MVLVKQLRADGRLSVKSFCLIGASLTCISIFQYHERISRGRNNASLAVFPVDNNQFIEANPQRLDIACCGVGHRFETLAAAARDLSPAPVEVNWGPCEGASNVFGEIFQPNNVFIPYEPSPFDAPFPEQRDLASAGINAANREVPIQVQEALVALVLELSDRYMSEINDFKQRIGWDEAPVIGLHIRTGNFLNSTSTYERESKQLHRRVGGRLQEKIGLENALYLYMKHAVALAEKIGVSENFRVLVVTDSNDVLETLDNLTGLPHWFHRPQPYTEIAHPLVYGNLHLNNGGDRCQIDWFSQPVMDLHLLASADAMLTSMHSTFYRIAEMANLMHGRPVCHCSQNNTMPQTCKCVGEDNTLIPDFVI